MRVIVTGGSGKAGAWVVRELAGAGHEVTNIDRQNPPPGLPGHFIRLDLTDAGQVYDAFFQVRPHAVCHLAANPSPVGFPRVETFVNNTAISYNVFQASGDIGTVRRFIYASSEMATGWLTTEERPARFPFDETARVDSPSAYALSKYLGEIIADSFSARHPDIAFVSLRINNVIGPEEYARLQERRDDYPNGGSGNFWSYIDARDVGGAFRASVEGKSSGHEVFLIAARDTGIEQPLADALLAKYGPEIAARLKPNHGPHDSVFDCGKIEKAFGWTARHSWRDEAVS